MWMHILDALGLYAAKILRKIAPVCHLFAQRARTHPDNNTPQIVAPTD